MEYGNQIQWIVKAIEITEDEYQSQSVKHNRTGGRKAEQWQRIKKEGWKSYSRGRMKINESKKVYNISRRSVINIKRKQTM